MKQSKSGFTIVELLIVIVVIGILAAITIVTYGGMQQRARGTERNQDMSTVQKLLEAYYIDNSTYPNMLKLRDPAWRTANLVTSDQGVFINPQAPAGTDNSFRSPGSVVATNGYSYYTLSGDSSISCGAEEVIPCTGYVLNWRLEQNNELKQVRIQK